MTPEQIGSEPEGEPACIYCGGIVGVNCFDPQGHQEIAWRHSHRETMTPEQIAGGLIDTWIERCNYPDARYRRDLKDAIAAALQAEREDGSRRVNDAIGDRDPIIESLKQQLQAEREEARRVIEPLYKRYRAYCFDLELMRATEAFLERFEPKEKAK